MDDFFVLVISKDLFAYSNIRDFFEEEDQITFVDTLNSTGGYEIALNTIAADFVVFMDTWASGKVFKRICKKVNTPYFTTNDVEKAKEIIAEKFIEWSDTRGA